IAMPALRILHGLGRDGDLISIPPTAPLYMPHLSQKMGAKEDILCFRRRFWALRAELSTGPYVLSTGSPQALHLRWPLSPGCATNRAPCAGASLSPVSDFAPRSVWAASPPGRPSSPARAALARSPILTPPSSP